MTVTPIEVDALSGLRWSPRGYATLSGAPYQFVAALEARLDEVAAAFGAEPLQFPPFLPVAELQRIDYFGSFPHLATFATHLDGDDQRLASFAAAPLAADQSAAVHDHAPIHEVLTPAACYHLYVHFQGAAFAERRVFTTTATCYRREDYYRPLERQWAFTMREVVAMGTSDEVKEFLAEGRERVDALAADLGLPVRWEHATDPFFRPSRNPQYLMQRIDPTKHELIYGDGLAIGSINLHHDHFGRAFAIDRTPGDTPATTGCVAFGIERWLAAVVREHGLDPANWPLVDRDA